MNEITNVTGAIIVAIITLTGTYFINEFTKNLDYKNTYYTQIVNRRLDAIEKVGECLDYFSAVKICKIATRSFTYYPWLENKEEGNKVINDLYSIGGKTVWMNSDLTNSFYELINEVSEIRESDYNQNDKNEKYAFMEKNSGILREKSIKVQQELYKSLQDGLNIKKFIEDKKVHLLKMTR